MNREGHDSVDFFVGTEVEHLPTYGMQTLFVVGLQDPVLVAKKAKKKRCSAIYFGANHSFALTEGLDKYDAWMQWENMIYALLKEGYWCALDIDVNFIEDLLESGLCDHPNFIPSLSLKIPYINQLGYNAVLKLDDKDFKATNPGVWVHRVHDLLDNKVFTHWSKYDDDKTL